MNCYSFLGHEYSFVNTIVSCLTTFKRLKSQKSWAFVARKPTRAQPEMPSCKSNLFANTCFPHTARHEIVCLQNTFFWLMIWMASSVELTDTLNCRFFLNRFPVCFNLFVHIFLVTSCLILAVQPCMEWISIKEGEK